MLENIRKLPAIRTVVPEWAMDRLKEAADHYVKGFWLASIALCGAITEFLSYFLLEKYICSEGIDKIIEHTKNLHHQKGRLQILKKLDIISEDERKLLDKIREIRNKCIHLTKIDFNGEEIEEDSLTSISCLIDFLNNHPSFKMRISGNQR